MIGGTNTSATVITVTYRSRDAVLDLLADLDQCPTSLRVIVVDNDSRDGTVEAIAVAHPAVEVIANPTNVGFAKANNQALELTETEFVIFLNPDTRIPTQTVGACLAEMSRQPDVGILTPRVVDRGGRLDRRCMRGAPTPWAIACHVSRLDRILPRPLAGNYVMRWADDRQAMDVAAASGAAMWCRTEAVRATGGFDEQFFMYGEDVVLCSRVRALGWRVRYWPVAEVTHFGRGSGFTVRSATSWATAAWRVMGETTTRN